MSLGVSRCLGMWLVLCALIYPCAPASALFSPMTVKPTLDT